MTIKYPSQNGNVGLFDSVSNALFTVASCRPGGGEKCSFAHPASIPPSESSNLIFHDRTFPWTFSNHVLWMTLMANWFILSHIVTMMVQGWILGPSQLDENLRTFVKNSRKTEPLLLLDFKLKPGTFEGHSEEEACVYKIAEKKWK